MGNEELARHVVRRFLADLPEQFAALSQAVASGDSGAVTQAAHAIKGAAANSGGAQLRALAWKVEQLGRAGDLAGAAATMPDLSASFDSAQPIMQEFSARVALTESRSCLLKMGLRLSPLVGQALPPANPSEARTGFFDPLQIPDLILHIVQPPNNI